MKQANLFEGVMGMRSVMLMFSGLPGTGKSTAAEKLARSLNYSLVSLLGIRQERGPRTAG